MVTCPKCGSRVGGDGNCQPCLLQLGISQQGSGAAPSGQFPLPSIEQIALQFPQLEIKRLIGRGGMGAIYQARQTALDRDVALKLIAREVSNDPMFVERFEREAKALAKLSHPNIVTVFDFGRTSDGMAYLVMEFVDGVNLREAIETKSVGSEDALELVVIMCRALEYAHAKGVVHRDIKPENILLGEDGSLKIADFGIAKIVDDSKHPPTLTATRQVLGSLHYLAPEQIESPEQVDHRVDLYALGVIFYELLTGQLPLGRFEPPSAVDARVDQRIDAIVMKTLHRKPSMRYQNALQLESDIQQIRTGSERPVGAVGDSQTTRGRTSAVPFQIEMFGGMANAKGIAQATPEGLRIEYRVADAIWGGIKSQLHSVLIPVASLVRVALKNGVFSSSLTVVADSIAVLGQLPGSETGEVVLSVKKSDREDARRVVQALGFGSRAGMEIDSQWDEPIVNPVQAILMTICGFLNAGWLATAIVFVNQKLDGDALAFSAIGISILFGLMVALQVISGILHATLGIQAPYRAAMIVSMVPITPVVLFSFPLAIWYWTESRWPDASPAKGLATQTPKSWGATTMMYLRENRRARIVSVLNVIGMVIFALSLGYYYAGLYRVEICYRIIPDAEAIQKVEAWDTARIQGNPYKEADVRMVIAGVRARLADMNGLAVSTGGTSNRLYIQVNRYQKEKILDGLKIEKCPQIVFLAASNEEGELPAEAVEVDMAKGISVDGLIVVKSSVGDRVVKIGESWNLEPQMVQKVAVQGNSHQENSPSSQDLVSLSIEWTAEGRRKLHEKAKGREGVGGIGLVVDGVVRGIAKIEGVASDETEFQLISGMKLNAASIMAAIRGPSLPFELEQLK